MPPRELPPRARPAGLEPEDFDEAVATATAEATTPTADYLMGMPHLAENLEAGLEALGIDVTGEEEDLL